MSLSPGYDLLGELATGLAPPAGSTVCLPCFSRAEHPGESPSSAAGLWINNFMLPSFPVCSGSASPWDSLPGSLCLQGLTLGTPPWLLWVSDVFSLHQPPFYSEQSDPTPAGVYPPGKLTWNDVPREPGKCRGKDVALEVIKLQFSVRESFMEANLGDVERFTVKLMLLFFFFPSFIPCICPSKEVSCSSG